MERLVVTDVYIRVGERGFTFEVLSISNMYIKAKTIRKMYLRVQSEGVEVRYHPNDVKDFDPSQPVHIVYKYFLDELGEKFPELLTNLEFTDTLHTIIKMMLPPVDALPPLEGVPSVQSIAQAAEDTKLSEKAATRVRRLADKLART